MNIFENKSAVIFDCDGVLVDSEEMSCYALHVIFEKEYGIDIGNDYTSVLGTSLTHSLQYFLNKFTINQYDLAYLMGLKEKAYFALVKNNLQSFDNCEQFIDALQSKNINVSVGSSGSLAKIEFSLTEVNLLHKFEIITSSSEVENGKPFPDLFLKCADKIKIKPSNCIVIEDSVNGIKAAKAAKMLTIGLTSSFGRSILENAGADLVVDDYSQLLTLLLD